MKLRSGQHYKMRNGGVAIVNSFYDIPYRDGRTGRPMTLRMAKGLVLGTTGERISWTTEGRYSPLGHDHPLDLVKKDRTAR